MLEQDGGCSLEELLLEDEHTINQCKSSNPKLSDFLCQKATLQKLITYATLPPQDTESHDIGHKFPFVAAEILTSSKTITQALIEGGWATADGDESDKKSESEDSENKLVRDILAANNKSEEKKETLVEQLDLDDDGQSKKKEDDADGEVRDGAEEGKRSDAAPALEAKLAKEEKKNDWSLLDQLLTAFLNTEDGEMLPVLCGYFNKIVGSLLTKERQKFLEFILLQRNGELFDGLMKHISHHSLALLLVELLQINIKADEPSSSGRDEGRKKGFSMLGSDGSDGSDGTDELDDHNNEEPALTPD